MENTLHKKELKQLLRKTTEYIEQEAEKHGLDVEDRIYAKLDKILTAKTRDEAVFLANKAVDSHDIHCLARGKRPKTAKWYEDNTKKALSLAKSKKLSGDLEEAERHIERAERYKKEAEKLRKEGST
jgi:hypothetical protein